MNKYLPITNAMRVKVSAEIKMLLHASRDCMRNQKRDTTQTSYVVSDGYFGEAFGVMRGLSLLGYGTINGPVNIDSPGNLRYWFSNLEQEVLSEENFGGSNECDHCLEKYRKDAVRKRPW